MPSPLILINLKTFREGMGNRAHLIANAAQLVAHESGVTIGIAPSPIDLHPLAHHFAIPVYAQHVDGFEPGAHTGHLTADALKMAGGVGSLINHSERRLTLAEIEASVRALQALKLIPVVCSNNEVYECRELLRSGQNMLPLSPLNSSGAGSRSPRQTRILSGNLLLQCMQ